jgi:hypothetical protein
MYGIVRVSWPELAQKSKGDGYQKASEELAKELLGNLSRHFSHWKIAIFCRQESAAVRGEERPFRTAFGRSCSQSAPLYLI